MPDGSPVVAAGGFGASSSMMSPVPGKVAVARSALTAFLRFMKKKRTAIGSSVLLPMASTVIVPSD